MEIKKIILYFAVALLGSFIWIAWQEDYSQLNNPSVKQKTRRSHSEIAHFTPPGFSFSHRSAEVPKSSSESLRQTTSSISQATALNTISVKTDVLKLSIDLLGGNIISAKLLHYPVSVEEKETPVQILTERPDQLYVAQSGITRMGQKSLTYSAQKNHYLLKSDQNSLQIQLTSKTKNNLKVTKTFFLKRGSYAVKQIIEVENKGSKIWKGSVFEQITRKNTVNSSLLSRSYDGAAISSHHTPYQKLTFKALSEKDLSQNIEGGWIAMQQAYFLTAWVPSTQNENHYYSRMFGEGEKGQNNVFILGYVSSPAVLKQGQSFVSQSTLYVGPELADQLNAVAKGLDLTIDYGWLWFLAKPIFYVMKAIHQWIGNWGWSIILITFLIKVLFYPLSAKSYQSMVKMRELTPRLQALRERYGDDKQGLGRATMELYKREKVSPVGGCLPMLIQIPVFIALYYVLIESVDLRQAPFIFWIQDLSTKDGYHVLPILMAASMLWQQKLSPSPPDPTQAKMMMFLPLIFLFVFWSFPAGLVLYWLTNNVLSILQQWYVMKTYSVKSKRR